MKKIISKKKEERQERNAAIVKDYRELMNKGSDKTAVYKYLAEKYNLKCATSVCKIIKESTRPKRNTKKK